MFFWWTVLPEKKMVYSQMRYVGSVAPVGYQDFSTAEKVSKMYWMREDRYKHFFSGRAERSIDADSR